MALGDSNNYGRGSNQNPNRVFDPTFYSRIRIKNKDKQALDFNYSKGLLKVILSGEVDNFKWEPITEINLSPTKAKMLIEIWTPFIEKMKAGEFIDPNSGFGINAGIKETVSYIALKVTGNRTDVPEHEIVIGKINGQGEVQDEQHFVFNVDYDFSLEWSNFSNMEVDKKIHQFMGIQTFMDVLTEFSISSAGAIGASVFDAGRYEMNRLSRKMDPIYDKLGIERRNLGSGSAAENFFTRQGSGSAMNPPTSSRSNNKTLDEIEGMIADEDDDMAQLLDED